MNKKKKLPNGFGQISKITGKNLKKPYRVMISVGKDDSGKNISRLLKPVAYFCTYEEAYAALINYHKAYTLNKIYSEWLQKISCDIDETPLVNMSFLWSMINTDLKALPINEVTENILQENINNIKYVYRSRCKILLITLFKYATENGLISKNIAVHLNIKEEQ